MFVGALSRRRETKYLSPASDSLPTACSPPYRRPVFLARTLQDLHNRCPVTLSCQPPYSPVLCNHSAAHSFLPTKLIPRRRTISPVIRNLASRAIIIVEVDLEGLFVFCWYITCPFLLISYTITGWLLHYTLSHSRSLLFPFSDPLPCPCTNNLEGINK